MHTDAGTTWCPHCAQRLPAEPGYVVWCDRCDWNVDPTGPGLTTPAHHLELQAADSLRQELERGQAHRTGWDPARLTAYLLASALLVLSPTAVLAGVALLVFYRPLWLSVPVALIALAIGFLLRPRAQQLPARVHLVRRDQAPALFTLLDKIAARLGTRPVSAVAIGTDPDIRFLRSGWRFHPVVCVGLPLWAGLGPQDRVAALARALGQGRNGDTRHGWVVGAAESVLAQLQAAFTDQAIDEYKLDVASVIGATPSATHSTRLLNVVVGPAVRGYAWLLERATLRSKQRAEHLADRRAAEVAGSDATVWMLERLLLADASYRALERALRFGSGVPPLEAGRRAVTEVPRREIERRLRVSRLRHTHAGTSRSSTYLRVMMLRTSPATGAQVVLDTDESRAIDRELQTAAEAALKDLRAELPR